MKTMTKSEIKKKVKFKIKELKNIYNQLDVLMDETYITAKEMVGIKTETQIDEMVSLGNRIESARNTVEESYEHLKGGIF